MSAGAPVVEEGSNAPQEPPSPAERPWLSLAGALGGIGILGYVVWGARLLRPVADDYCAGRSAGEGFVGSLSYWFHTWSGDLTARAVDYALVGWPLTRLPWPLASSVAFLATAALVTGATVLLLRIGVLSSAHDLRRGLVQVVPVVAVAWWAFWWLPVRATSHLPPVLADGNALNLAQSITVWQIVNSSYVVVPSLLVIALVGLTPVWRRRWRIAVPVAFTVGVAFGMAGVVLAATTAAALGALLGLEVLLRRHWLPSRWATVALGCGLAAGVLISFTAPGSVLRSEALKQDPALPVLTPGSLLAWSLPEGIVEWGKGVVTPGSVLAAVLMAAMALALVRSGLRVATALLLRTGCGVLALSVLLSLLNRMSEAAAYPAFWHQVSTRTLIFMGVCVLGFAGGAKLALAASWLPTWLVAAPLLLALVGVAASVSPMVDAVEERFGRWQSGPAPMGVISDIEDPQGWQAECWEDVARGRSAPARGSR